MAEYPMQKTLRARLDAHEFADACLLAHHRGGVSDHVCKINIVHAIESADKLATRLAECQAELYALLAEYEDRAA